MKQLFLLIIKIYQYCISPLFPPRCRFIPSCSSYAKQVFEKFPIHLAIWYSSKRIFKCHPFHLGGYDPIPDKNCCHYYSINNLETYND
ncbi:MAG: membrane protein insertion efficiency factor YidD [Bacteriovoracaceae bacterium]|nr:membrane protein insertion efficiency factor YidD [Bacteriovoracaceae bacterium]